MSHPFPERIGRYQVQALLGHGGMGNVYLAIDPRLKRPLAIKTVRNREDDDQGRTLERFNREAEISAQLCHPNIITIYDVGEDPSAGVFLAMEYVKGQSLAAYIRDRRPGLETSLFLLIQAMRAIQAAHDGAIVHRDIKPENMLVSDTGRLKLMDFGLARGSHSRLTATGMVMGTPSFTAPEIMMGKEPGASTDRYAFSVTAFELLSGELPFKGETLGTTLYRIVHEPPIIPADMPATQAGVFLKALAKDPAERFPDLGSFMLDLIRGCPLPPAIQAKLVGLVEAEFVGQEIPARESTPPDKSLPEVCSYNAETQMVQTPRSGLDATPEASPVPPAPPQPPSSVPKLPRQTGPPLKLPLPNLFAKTAPQAPAKILPRPTPPGIPLKLTAHRPPVPKAAPAISRPKPVAPRPSPLEIASPLRAAPKPSAEPLGSPVLPAAAAPEFPAIPVFPEPIFDLEGAPVDDPFVGIDWDSVLAPQPTAEEALYHDLETSLEGIDALEFEERAEDAESQAQVRELEGTLSSLSSSDVLEAEERAEVEEAEQDLEKALAAAELPDLDLPDPPMPPKKKPRALLPPPPEFGS